MTIKFDKSKLVKNLAHGNVLAPFLDKAFETFDEPWTFDYSEKEHDTAWHPSGHCIPKASELYAIATGDDKRAPVSGSLRKSFMVGHYWHQLIQHIVVNKLEFASPDAIERRRSKEWAWELVYEPCTEGCIGGHGENCMAWQVKESSPLPYHWATGAGDIAPLETPKWKGIVDIKTMNAAHFKQGLPKVFARKYTCQINIYMDLFDEERGMILGVLKDGPHDFKEIRYERDQALIDAIYNKWRFVGECLDQEVPPTEEDDEEFVLPL